MASHSGVKTEALTTKADRLGVPLPTDEEGKTIWRQSQEDGSRYLTAKGQLERRKAIRQEQNEREERWKSWNKDVVGPIGALIISILSLLIAYAALHIKH